MTKRDSRPRGWGRVSILALGTVALLVVLDAGLGVALRRIWPPAEPVSVVDAVNFGTDPAEVRDDPRADLPAMEGAEWAEEYYRELQQTPHAYWPFTESRPLSFDGEHIDVQGWARESYESPAAGEGAPVVWLFGGSAAFGEGQRDEFTIASWLARTAEAAGTPIRVVNYGQREWTHFQEMVLFEQLLAEGPAPDVAVFYDGANEINAQSLSVKGVPTHVLADQYAVRISGGLADQSREEIATPGSWARLWHAYTSASLTRRVIEQIDQRLFASAGAAPDQADDGSTSVYVSTQEDAENAVEVYERGRRLTLHLADRYDVAPVLVWQPLIPNGPERWAAERITQPTLNLVDALAEHPEVFIDGAHTNERGARLVAEELWAEVAPLVDDGSYQPAPTEAPTTSTTTSVPVSTNRDVLAIAASKLEAAGEDPCRIEAWKIWPGSLRAADPAETAAVAELVGRWLRRLAAVAPADQAAAAAELSRVAQDLPAMAAAAAYDPDLPLVPQLPIAADGTSAFLTAFQSVSEAVASSCETAG